MAKTSAAENDIGRRVFTIRDRRSNTMMGYGYGGHMSGWGWAVMGVGSVLLWVVLVLGALVLARHLRGTAGRGEGGSQVEPEALLAARYARGDIDDEDYHHRLDTLRNRSSSMAAR